MLSSFILLELLVFLRLSRLLNIIFDLCPIFLLLCGLFLDLPVCFTPLLVFICLSFYAFVMYFLEVIKLFFLQYFEFYLGSFVSFPWFVAILGTFCCYYRRIVLKWISVVLLLYVLVLFVCLLFDFVVAVFCCCFFVVVVIYFAFFVH